MTDTLAKKFTGIGPKLTYKGVPLEHADRLLDASTEAKLDAPRFDCMFVITDLQSGEHRTIHSTTNFADCFADACYDFGKLLAMNPHSPFWYDSDGRGMPRGDNG